MAGQFSEPSLWLNWLRAPGEVTALMEIGVTWSISCWIFVRKGTSTGSPLLSMLKTHVFSMDFPWFSLESIEKRKYIGMIQKTFGLFGWLWMTGHAGHESLVANHQFLGKHIFRRFISWRVNAIFTHPFATVTAQKCSRNCFRWFPYPISSCMCHETWRQPCVIPQWTRWKSEGSRTGWIFQMVPNLHYARSGCAQF